MSAEHAARSGPPPRASLGHSEGDDIFGTFDPDVARRIAPYLKPHMRLLVLAQAAVLLTAAAQVALPMAIGAVIDSLVRADEGRLRLAIAGFVLLTAVYSGFFYFEQWLSGRLAQHVISDIRRSMFSHLQNISLGFMDKTHVGRLMARLNGDVGALQEFVQTSTGAIGEFVMLIGIAVVLLSIDLKLGLLTLTVLPVLILIRAIWLPFSKTSYRAARDASSTANSALAENINGVRTVQESRREAVNFELYGDKARDNMRAQSRASFTSNIMTPVVDVMTGLGIAIVVVVGGNAVLGGRIEVGVMVAFILYVQRFFDPVRMLSNQYTVMQRAMAAGRRIFEVLDVPVAIGDSVQARDLGDEPASVEFCDVSFGYDPARPVLRNISFKASHREVVALVGPTGSGKTSIISLMRRFYEADRGQVLIGGRDVRDITLGSLGRRIGMVLQEPFLFTGTIEENIRYNTQGASFEDVVEAAKAVSAHDFIMRLPDGYQTKLGQRGRNISMGQRQLISFARALVADPQILILDEATANIDSFTEQAIQKALKVLFAGRTCIVIAHRLATIRDADRIIVLRQGEIVEQGSHQQLLALGGLYSQLSASAIRSFDDHDVK